MDNLFQISKDIVKDQKLIEQRTVMLKDISAMASAVFEREVKDEEVKENCNEKQNWIISYGSLNIIIAFIGENMYGFYMFVKKL